MRKTVVALTRCFEWHSNKSQPTLSATFGIAETKPIGFRFWNRRTPPPQLPALVAFPVCRFFPTFRDQHTRPLVVVTCTFLVGRREAGQLAKNSINTVRGRVCGMTLHVFGKNTIRPRSTVRRGLHVFSLVLSSSSSSHAMITRPREALLSRARSSVSSVDLVSSAFVKNK